MQSVAFGELCVRTLRTSHLFTIEHFKIQLEFMNFSDLCSVDQTRTNIAYCFDIPN